MQFVDDRAGQRCGQPLVIGPVKRIIDHDRFRHAPRVVAKVASKIFLFAPDHVSEHLIRPDDLARYRLRVWIDQQLRTVKTQAVLGFVGPAHPVTVKLPRLHIGKKNVPNLIGLFCHWNANIFLLRIETVEQAKIDTRRRRGKHRKVHAVTQPGRTERIRIAEPGLYRSHKREFLSNMESARWQCIKRNGVTQVFISCHRPAPVNSLLSVTNLSARAGLFRDWTDAESSVLFPLSGWPRDKRIRC